MTSKLGQPHLKSARETLFTLHTHKKKKKGTGAGAEQFPTKDSKRSETWHTSERNKICKHAQGKFSWRLGQRLRAIQLQYENLQHFTFC